MNINDVENVTVETSAPAPHGQVDAVSGGRPAPTSPYVAGRPTIAQLQSAILSCAAGSFCAVDDPQARQDAELAATAAELLNDLWTVTVHYRTRVHKPADLGWTQVTTWVDDHIVQIADQLLTKVRAS